MYDIKYRYTDTGYHNGYRFADPTFKDRLKDKNFATKE